MEKNSSLKRVRLIVSGDVQGVGYRAWAVREACELNLIGWVKNRQDGTVEIVAQGKKTTLDEFVRRCKKGPDVAWVKHVQPEWLEAMGELIGFQVLY